MDYVLQRKCVDVFQEGAFINMLTGKINFLLNKVRGGKYLIRTDAEVGFDTQESAISQ